MPAASSDGREVTKGVLEPSYLCVVCILVYPSVVYTDITNVLVFPNVQSPDEVCQAER